MLILIAVCLAFLAQIEKEINVYVRKNFMKMNKVHAKLAYLHVRLAKLEPRVLLVLKILIDLAVNVNVFHLFLSRILNALI